VSVNKTTGVVVARQITEVAAENNWVARDGKKTKTESERLFVRLEQDDGQDSEVVLVGR
jgi:hypothetical protein